MTVEEKNSVQISAETDLFGQNLTGSSDEIRFYKRRISNAVVLCLFWLFGNIKNSFQSWTANIINTIPKAVKFLTQKRSCALQQLLKRKTCKIGILFHAINLLNIYYHSQAEMKVEHATAGWKSQGSSLQHSILFDQNLESFASCEQIVAKSPPKLVI